MKKEILIATAVVLALLCFLVSCGKTETRNKESESFTIAAWNIGHFSKGQHKNSDFFDSDYAKKSAEFKKYIDESVGADIITLSDHVAVIAKISPLDN